jgi:hypothetical protein
LAYIIERRSCLDGLRRFCFGVVGNGGERQLVLALVAMLYEIAQAAQHVGTDAGLALQAGRLHFAHGAEIDALGGMIHARLVLDLDPAGNGAAAEGEPGGLDPEKADAWAVGIVEQVCQEADEAAGRLHDQAAGIDMLPGMDVWIATTAQLGNAAGDGGHAGNGRFQRVAGNGYDGHEQRGDVVGGEMRRVSAARASRQHAGLAEPAGNVIDDAQRYAGGVSGISDNFGSIGHQGALCVCASADHYI